MRKLDVSDRSLCESEQIGARTRVGAFANVRAGARIGEDCEIAAGAFIDDDVVLGDRVSVGYGAHLCAGVELADDVTVGPNTTFSDEPLAWDSATSDRSGRTIINARASIGANATVAAGIEIGRGAKVGAGAVVPRSVPPNAIVIGNPAHIVGYTGSPLADTRASRLPASEPGTVSLGVRGVRVQHSAEFSDLRGSLTAGELPQDAVPFVPRRWFLVYDVPNLEVRGEHAHRLCHQFLTCVSGSMTVAVDDGENRAEVALDAPTLGLYIPPLVWASQFRYSADAVLLVLASHPYDASDYIRDYEQFLKTVTS